MRLTAAVSLIALLVSFAGSASASTCHLRTAVPTASRESHDSHSDAPAPCPFAVSGSTCAVSASAPSTPTTLAAIVMQHYTTPAFNTHAPSLLRDVAIFHPPRS